MYVHMNVYMYKCESPTLSQVLPTSGRREPGQAKRLTLVVIFVRVVLFGTKLKRHACVYMCGCMHV